MNELKHPVIVDGMVERDHCGTILTVGDLIQYEFTRNSCWGYKGIYQGHIVLNGEEYFLNSHMQPDLFFEIPKYFKMSNPVNVKVIGNILDELSLLDKVVKKITDTPRIVKTSSEDRIWVGNLLQFELLQPLANWTKGEHQGYVVNYYDNMHVVHIDNMNCMMDLETLLASATQVHIVGEHNPLNKLDNSDNLASTADI